MSSADYYCRSSLPVQAILSRPPPLPAMPPWVSAHFIVIWLTIAVPYVRRSHTPPNANPGSTLHEGDRLAYRPLPRLQRCHCTHRACPRKASRTALRDESRPPFGGEPERPGRVHHRTAGESRSPAGGPMAVSRGRCAAWRAAFAGRQQLAESECNPRPSSPAEGGE